MSEITRGVISMPLHLAMSSKLSRAQFHACAQEILLENFRLKEQVTALQSAPDSWQSGYDEGRKMGTKTALSERDQLKAVNFDLHAGQQMMEEEIARLKAENEDGLAVIRTQKEQLDCYIKDAERLDRLDLECEGYGCNLHEGNRWVLDGPFNSARDAIDALADLPELKLDHDYDYDLGN